MNNGLSGGPTDWAELIGPWDSYCFPHPITCQQGVTIAFWIYPMSDAGKYLSIVAPTLDNGFTIRNFNGIYIDLLHNHGSPFSSKKVLLGKQEWTHVAVIFDFKNMEANLYTNAEHRTFMSYATMEVSSRKAINLLVGKQYRSDLDPEFGATIDDLLIWESALTSADIELLYVSCPNKQKSCINPDNVQGAYKVHNHEGVYCPGERYEYSSFILWHAQPIPWMRFGFNFCFFQLVMLMC